MKIKEEDVIFLEILQDRFPEKKKLASMLVDILNIERESVYRRLRKEVPFTFSEVSKICRAMNISLDNLIGMGYDSAKIRPARLVIQDFLNPTQTDYDILESYVDCLRRLKEYEQSEICIVENSIPQVFYVKYEYLYRLVLLKWNVQNTGSISNIRYKDICIPEKLKEINRQYIENYTSAQSTHLVLDRYIFEHLVNDLQFFSLFNAVDKEEIEAIKEEIFALINEMNTLCMNGCYANGNECNVYISHINIKAAMETLSISEDFKLSMCAWVRIMDNASVDIITYQTVRKRVESMIRTSTLISQSADVERIKYFNEQIKIVNNL